MQKRAANGLFPNPTPDGKMPGESKNSPREIQNYLGRISGPLLDRIDLQWA
jgi:predicted ATPase with chaperone activity